MARGKASKLNHKKNQRKAQRHKKNQPPVPGPEPENVTTEKQRTESDSEPDQWPALRKNWKTLWKDWLIGKVLRFGDELDDYECVEAIQQMLRLVVKSCDGDREGLDYALLHLSQLCEGSGIDFSGPERWQPEDEWLDRLAQDLEQQVHEKESTWRSSALAVGSGELLKTAVGSFQIGATTTPGCQGSLGEDRMGRIEESRDEARAVKRRCEDLHSQYEH